MSEAFIGAWRVCEHMFDPSGAFIGVVHQRRRLERLSSSRMRVIQDCEPLLEIQGHPMARFAGHHEFELVVEGDERRYLGPAVIGSARAYGPGAMIGAGLWPDFAHGFTSFSVVPEAHIQLTGGRFFTASSMVANIAGVAVPEGTKGTDEPDWPRLEGPTWPGDVASEWTGIRRSVDVPSGLRTEVEVIRRFDDDSWIERSSTSPYEEVRLECPHPSVEHAHRIEAVYRTPEGRIRCRGMARRYGWLLDADVVGDPRHDASPHIAISSTQMLDSRRGHFVAMTQWFRSGEPRRVDVSILRPTEMTHE